MSNCRHLVYNIAYKSNLKILPFRVDRFPSGEVVCHHAPHQSHHGAEGVRDPWIPHQVRDDYNHHHLHILGNIHHPVNDNIMELLSMIDLAKNIGFRNISLIIPYMGYSRQDRMDGAASSVGFRILANMINQAGIQNLITIDIHSPQALRRYFSCNVINITPLEILLDNNFPMDDCQIICPDMGSSSRAIPEGKLCGMTRGECGMTMTITKTRSESGMKMNLEANLKGKKCIIIDDIIDSGATISGAIEALKQRGAGEIIIYATHILNQPDIDAKLFRSNTICGSGSDGFLDVSNLIAKKLSMSPRA